MRNVQRQSNIKCKESKVHSMSYIINSFITLMCIFINSKAIKINEENFVWCNSIGMIDHYIPAMSFKNITTQKLALNLCKNAVSDYVQKLPSEFIQEAEDTKFDAIYFMKRVIKESLSYSIGTRFVKEKEDLLMNLEEIESYTDLPQDLLQAFLLKLYNLQFSSQLNEQLNQFQENFKKLHDELGCEIIKEKMSWRYSGAKRDIVAKANEEDSALKFAKSVQLTVPKRKSAVCKGLHLTKLLSENLQKIDEMIKRFFVDNKSVLGEIFDKLDFDFTSVKSALSFLYCLSESQKSLFDRQFLLNLKNIYEVVSLKSIILLQQTDIVEDAASALSYDLHFLSNFYGLNLNGENFETNTIPKEYRDLLRYKAKQSKMTLDNLPQEASSFDINSFRNEMKAYINSIQNTQQSFEVPIDYLSQNFTHQIVKKKAKLLAQILQKFKFVPKLQSAYTDESKYLAEKLTNHQLSINHHYYMQTNKHFEYFVNLYNMLSSIDYYTNLVIDFMKDIIRKIMIVNWHYDLHKVFASEKNMNIQKFSVCDMPYHERQHSYMYSTFLQQVYEKTFTYLFYNFIYVYQNIQKYLFTQLINQSNQVDKRGLLKKQTNILIPFLYTICPYIFLYSKSLLIYRKEDKLRNLLNLHKIK